jgi:hypothetical protein
VGRCPVKQEVRARGNVLAASARALKLGRAYSFFERGWPGVGRYERSVGMSVHVDKRRQGQPARFVIRCCHLDSGYFTAT